MMAMRFTKNRLANANGSIFERGSDSSYGFKSEVKFTAEEIRCAGFTKFNFDFSKITMHYKHDAMFRAGRLRSYGSTCFPTMYLSSVNERYDMLHRLKFQALSVLGPRVFDTDDDNQISNLVREAVQYANAMNEDTNPNMLMFQSVLDRIDSPTLNQAYKTYFDTMSKTKPVFLSDFDVFEFRRILKDIRTSATGATSSMSLLSRFD
jgi:hypothetical protein